MTWVSCGIFMALVAIWGYGSWLGRRRLERARRLLDDLPGRKRVGM